MGRPQVTVKAIRVLLHKCPRPIDEGGLLQEPRAVPDQKIKEFLTMHTLTYPMDC